MDITALTLLMQRVQEVPELHDECQMLFGIDPVAYAELPPHGREELLSALAQPAQSSDPRANIGFAPVWVQTCLDLKGSIWHDDDWPAVASAIYKELTAVSSQAQLLRLASSEIVVEIGACRIRSSGIEYSPAPLNDGVSCDGEYTPMRAVLLKAVCAYQASGNHSAMKHSSMAIARHIDSFSSQDIDVEYVCDYFENCHALLALVPLASLIPGNADANLFDEDKQGSYDMLDSATAPPIVINESGEVEDGNHRLRSAVRHGKSAMLAYIVMSTDVEVSLWKQAKEYARTQALVSQEPSSSTPTFGL